MTLTNEGAAELAQLMEGTTAGAPIPEIVRRGLQELLEAEVSALTGAQLHERCPDQRSSHRNGYRNGYRRRLRTSRVGDLTRTIPAPGAHTPGSPPAMEVGLITPPAPLGTGPLVGITSKSHGEPHSTGDAWGS